MGSIMKDSRLGVASRLRFETKQVPYQWCWIYIGSFCISDEQWCSWWSENFWGISNGLSSYLCDIGSSPCFLITARSLCPFLPPKCFPLFREFGECTAFNLSQKLVPDPYQQPWSWWHPSFGVYTALCGASMLVSSCCNISPDLKKNKLHACRVAGGWGCSPAPCWAAGWGPQVSAVHVPEQDHVVQAQHCSAGTLPSQRENRDPAQPPCVAERETVTLQAVPGIRSLLATGCRTGMVETFNSFSRWKRPWHFLTFQQDKARSWLNYWFGCHFSSRECKKGEMKRINFLLILSAEAWTHSLIIRSHSC